MVRMGEGRSRYYLVMLMFTDRLQTVRGLPGLPTLRSVLVIMNRLAFPFPDLPPPGFQSTKKFWVVRISLSTGLSINSMIIELLNIYRPHPKGGGRLCFHRCVSVHGGGGTPVPGSFPGDWSQVLSGISQSWQGVPQSWPGGYPCTGYPLARAG